MKISYMIALCDYYLDYKQIHPKGIFSKKLEYRKRFSDSELAQMTIDYQSSRYGHSVLLICIRLFDYHLYYERVYPKVILSKNFDYSKLFLSPSCWLQQWRACLPKNFAFIYTTVCILAFPGSQ